MSDYDNAPEFDQDLLRGADEIAEFLFGDREAAYYIRQIVVE